MMNSVEQLPSFFGRDDDELALSLEPSQPADAGSLLEGFDCLPPAPLEPIARE